jgi:polar amino acid transport system substrate-binding protein
MLVTAYTYTPERAQQVAFSDPYYATAIAIAIRNDKPQIKSKDQLTGTTIGAELGTTGDREAHSVKDVKDIKTYDTLMLALQDLEIGRLDAVISTLPPLQYLIHKNFRRTEVTATYDAGWMGVNVPIEEKTLLAEVNRILKKLKDDGELAILNAKWFGESEN